MKVPDISAKIISQVGDVADVRAWLAEVDRYGIADDTLLTVSGRSRATLIVKFDPAAPPRSEAEPTPPACECGNEKCNGPAEVHVIDAAVDGGEPLPDPHAEYAAKVREVFWRCVRSWPGLTARLPEEDVYSAELAQDNIVARESEYISLLLPGDDIEILSEVSRHGESDFIRHSVLQLSTENRLVAAKLASWSADGLVILR